MRRRCRAECVKSHKQMSAHLNLLKRSYLVISFKKNIFQDTTKAPLQLLAPSNNNRGTAVCPLVLVNVVCRIDSSTSFSSLDQQRVVRPIDGSAPPQWVDKP